MSLITLIPPNIPPHTSGLALSCAPHFGALGRGVEGSRSYLNHPVPPASRSPLQLSALSCASSRVFALLTLIFNSKLIATS
jgi:hypothetical protein